MRTHRLFAFLLVAALTLAACDHARCRCEEVLLASCGVVVQVPSDSKEATSVVKTADVATNTTHHTTRFDESVYEVRCSDLAGRMANSLNADDVLRAAVQDTLERSGATLDSQMLIELHGYPGRDFEGSAPIDGEPVFVRARAYLVGNRLIQTTVRGVRGQVSVADVVRYLDSLTFLENKIQDLRSSKQT
ncbi:MAG: hypothetical protein HC853_09410 [Anaerolineae bacterium]|nr:hypothetical protein [Anaerolineae bacterium]